MLNPSYSLTSSKTYTPSPPDANSDCDFFAPASATIGPDICVGAARTGIDYSIVRHSTHSIGALSGLVRATHQGTGATRFDSFSFAPFMQYYLGLNRGDAGSDSDNGFGCVSDGRLDTSLATVNLFSNTPFALAMASSNTLSSFQIAVAAPVPEPQSFAFLLAGLGLTGLVVRRRRAADTRIQAG